MGSPELDKMFGRRRTGTTIRGPSSVDIKVELKGQVKKEEELHYKKREGTKEGKKSRGKERNIKGRKGIRDKCKARK